MGDSNRGRSEGRDASGKAVQQGGRRWRLTGTAIIPTMPLLGLWGRPFRADLILEFLGDLL